MEFQFQIAGDPLALPKHSGVYKIFDTRDKLIVLDKTSNLFQRFERYYGPRSEMVRDLDLREITGRIEYLRTDSTFETLYVLYRESKKFFPKTYRKMRTCSRPSNNDIDGGEYVEAVEYSIRFIEGRDEEMAQALVQKMNNLSMDTKFEEAEIVRRRLDKIHRA